MKITVITFAMAAGLAPAASLYTYVSSTGNDSNACSLAAPCRTFAGAYSKTLQGGTITALDSSDFGRGATLTISAIEVTIDGGLHGATFTGPNGGTAISVDTGIGMPLILRNITVIVGTGANSCGICGSVESNTTLLLDNVAVLAEDQAHAKGVSLSTDTSASAELRNVRIAGGETGLQVESFASTPYNLTLDRVDISGVAMTAAVLLDGNVVVKDSTFRFANAGMDCGSASGTASLLLNNANFTDNNIGLFNAGCVVKLNNDTFANNTTGISNFSGTLISFRNNVFTNNGTDGAPTMSASLK